jgi:septal ring factor EnvC (AmiA/AmiB activator)
MKKQIVVNEEKRKVAAILFDRGRKFVGKAKCMPGDTFDSDLGIKMASLRAKKKRDIARNKSVDQAIKYHENQIAMLQNLKVQFNASIKKIDTEIESLDKQLA